MSNNLIKPSVIDLELYGGRDPRCLPRYSFPDASRATGIPVSTLRNWVVGLSYKRLHDDGYFEPVISRPSDADNRLSFMNLIESHILRALREVHKVSLKHVREAIDVAEREFDIQHLLVSPELRTSAGTLFLDKYTHLMELSLAQQYVIRGVLENYLERVEYDETRLPHEFLPFERIEKNKGEHVIAISPFVAFGRAILRRTGISTRAVVNRIVAGEAPEVVMSDYGLEKTELEEAILYESTAA